MHHRIIKWLLRIVIAITGLSLAISLTFYLKVKVYNFPEPEPFTGDQWYIPYQNLQDTLLKANFHAHAFCWGGLTYGENSEEELYNAYRKKGYDVVGISNYLSISDSQTDDPCYIPMYEHGLNVNKVHCLAIGANRVASTLFPLHLTTHQKQQEIEAVRNVTKLVAMAHPSDSRYSDKEMSQLSGYDLMEVGNSIGMSTSHWDAALSAGKLSWIIGDDDTHSLQNQLTFIKWTRIYSKEPVASAVIESLQAGNHYGIESYQHNCEDNRLTEFRIAGDTLYIMLRDVANRIDLFGQDGAQRHTMARSDYITYLLTEDDTYIRAEIHHDDCVMYLNPVLRYSGTLPMSSIPPINPYKTWLVRVLVFTLLCTVVFGTRALFGRVRRIGN